MRRANLTKSAVIIVTAAAFALMIGTPAMSYSQEFQPVFQPSLELTKSERPIQIDGQIDPGEWQQASLAGNFAETYPGKNIEPSLETRAYLTYDDDNLYVAFRCYDDPSQLRATMCQRDQFNDDDAVYLMLDTYGNATWTYELFVNPYGVQKDYLWSNVHGDDRGFDLIWQSAASIDDSGYSVEMAIPFASMRFPSKDVQTWKIDLGRNLPRESFKQFSWAAYNPDDQCRVCQYGTVNGIKNVVPGKGVELMPTLIANQSGSLESNDPHASWNSGKADGELSMGGKYSVSSDITIEGTYNPDFSQIEADAAQIDVNSTISLLYPERRPFFQEGRDIFQTLFNSFYTRTVNDPQFAAKLTGRLSRYNIGFLSAYDKNTPYIIPLEERSLLVNTGNSTVNVLRATRAFKGDHHLGMIVTDRRFEGGGYGTVISTDGFLHLSSKYSFVGQFIGTFTKEQDDSALNEGLEGLTFADGKHTVAFDGEYYSGDAMITQFRRRARNWNFTVDYNHVSPSYRTETGYDPWNNYHNFSIWNGLDIYPESGIFTRISPQTYFDNRWNYDGEKKWTRANIGLESNLRWAQTYAGVYFHRMREMWGGRTFDGLWNLEFYSGSQFSNALGYEMNFNFGPNVARWLLLKGNELSFYGALLIKPIDRLIIEPTVNYARSEEVNTGEELYEQLIGRVRFQLQANKELSTRLVVQYNDNGNTWDIDPLLTYRISSFSMFYIGSTHNIAQLTDVLANDKIWRQTSQQFFMKIQYLFRL